MEDQNDSNRVDSEFEEAVPVYANNVRFEMTAWDLRVLFGQLASTTISGEPGVDWHTDVTIPWIQAKLMHFYLGVNLALYETENGTIKIPTSVLPPKYLPPKGTDLNDAQVRASFGIVEKLLTRFLETQSKKGSEQESDSIVK